MTERFTHFLVGACIFCVTDAAPAAESPVVVVNTKNSADALVSNKALPAIFGMRLRTWDDGSPIKVFVLPDNHPLHITFSKYILRVFPYQLRSAWDRLVFSGTGDEPFKVNSEQEMRAIVGSTPGAIGYLSDSMIDKTVKPILFKQTRNWQTL